MVQADQDQLAPMDLEEERFFKSQQRTSYDDCLKFNHCGRYGYCREDLADESPCDCKFWWSGKYCDIQTSSGKQVIAFGVMLAFLMALFYGLKLFHYSIKKRTTPSTDEVNQNIPIIVEDSVITRSTLTNQSRSFGSRIIVIGTILLGTGTLIIKWILLKSIHHEAVNKFEHGKTLLFEKHSLCSKIIFDSQFNITFPVACLLIIIFAITTKRVALQRDKCNGYFALPIPVDFFSHVKPRFTAVMFAIFADELLDIAYELLSARFNPLEDEGVIVEYVLDIIKVFVIGCRCYPLLAANYIHTRLSLACATLYAWLLFGVTIIDNNLCRNDYYSTDDDAVQNNIALYLNYYGTGSKLLSFQVCADIPRYLLLAYVSIKLPVLFFKQLYRKDVRNKQLSSEQKILLHSSLPYSTESQYIKNLSRSQNENRPSNRFTMNIRRIYTWRNDFRFSSRILCVYAAIFLLLFFLTMEACFRASPWVHELRKRVQHLVDSINSSTKSVNYYSTQSNEDSPTFTIPQFIRPFIIAISAALFATVVQLLILLASIRRNLLQTFRGDDCEIPRALPENNIDHGIENFHFAGTLIGYVLWNYVLVAQLILIITFLVEVYITYGSMRFIEFILKMVIPISLLIVFKIYLDRMLSRYVFLQRAGDVLSINNRRMLMIFLYFNLFFDAFLASITATLRIVKSAIGGTIYMCRLDYSPLGRKLEKLDDGFSTYCGFIHMECAHRHPILLCFASHLLRYTVDPVSTTKLSKSKRKWHLALFLVKNPAFIYQRKAFLARLKPDERNVILRGKGHMRRSYIDRLSSGAP
ncbi:unnamed protein product [Adineta ricciae]|uniref:EGF-like domain-containing protein n=1 Tax=Adineta ricciae TaxID=249248 RepID=A0A815P6M2_ADIRI|nr:unnamed protein product [Adineta ricciae]CAF1444921.1 unnamed protein product [Adineta ricciae]